MSQTRVLRTFVLLLALLFVPTVLGCTSDKDIITPRFVAVESCPADRVVVSPTTNLSLMVPDRAMPRPPLSWSEPVPPPSVAGDPDRLAIWIKTHRDPAYLAWTRANEASNPDTNAVAMMLRQVRLHEVVGCASRRLFACRDRVVRRPRTPVDSPVTSRECAEIPYGEGASSEMQHAAIAHFLGSDAEGYPVDLR